MRLSGLYLVLVVVVGVATFAPGLPASASTSGGAVGTLVATPVASPKASTPLKAPAGSAAQSLPASSPGEASKFYALVFLFVLYLAYAAVSGRVNPTWIAMGADGRLSSSKLQFAVWTAVVLYAYIALAIDRMGHVTFSGGMPPTNILIAMGLSLTTATMAKGIAVGYQQSGRAPINHVTPKVNARDLIMSDDNMTPDLPKIQMLAWTAVAVAVFLIDLFENFGSYALCRVGSAQCFPDIDTALMVLMGLGQGAYLGFKLVPSRSADPSQNASPTAPVDPDIPLHPSPPAPAPNAGLGKDLAP